MNSISASGGLLSLRELTPPAVWTTHLVATVSCVHAHAHDERRCGDRRALGLALALVLAFAVVEAVAGVAADSLALLADAVHRISDGGSLALALFALWLAGRPATAHHRPGSGASCSPPVPGRDSTTP